MRVLSLSKTVGRIRRGFGVESDMPLLCCVLIFLSVRLLERLFCCLQKDLFISFSLMLELFTYLTECHFIEGYHQCRLASLT